MKTIGLGVIGCGGRTNYLLQLLLKQSNAVKLVAICDPRTEALDRFNSRFNPTARRYSDHRQLLQDPGVDWVMIGSWNCFHKEHTVAAFRAGKHVFCEKPLATSLQDCLAMRQAWQQSGKQFAIGFTLRYSPHYREIKRLVAAGTIGQLLSLEFNETLDFNHGGYIMGDWRRLTKNAGTHLLEKCCHDVDLVNWIVGSSARRVASFGGLDFFTPENRQHVQRIGKDKQGRAAYATWGGAMLEDPFTPDKDIVDNQVAILEFNNNVRATFHTNCNAAIRERRMYLLGCEGTIRADVITGKIEVQRIGFEASVEDHSTTGKGGHGGGDEYLISCLLDTMLKGAPPVTTLEDGLRSALTCFAIDEALRSGQVVDVRPLWEQAGVPQSSAALSAV